MQPVVLDRLYGCQDPPRQRDLDGPGIEGLGIRDALQGSLLGVSREAYDERAMDVDAEVVSILREAASIVDAYAYLDLVENFLIARLVTD